MAQNYFNYLPENPLCEMWGCTVLSTGYTLINPGSAYPPVRHPDDHHFAWEKGRTLQAFQFALISSGRGHFTSAPHLDVTYEIKAGDVMLLYPGVWHRFAPDQDIGWTEHWIEMSGPALDRAMEQGLLPRNRPIWHIGQSEIGIFEEVHRLAQDDALANQPNISTLALQLLSKLVQERSRTEQSRNRLVDRARYLIMQADNQQQSLSSLAAELGVSYSTLRRLFREHTGISLKRYQEEVRIRRACELLRSSDKSVKAIAFHLGYFSASHFSARFRDETGLSPKHWREKNGPKWVYKLKS